MNSPYSERRSQLAQRLRDAGGGLALVLAAPPQPRNRDNDHPYRQDSYLHYLTGFDEPDSALLLQADGRSLFFCRVKDPARETWDGYRLGPQASVEALGIDEAHAIEELDRLLPALLNHQPCVWTLFEAQAHAEPHVNSALAVLRSQSHQGAVAPAARRDLALLIDEMRLIKSPQELATMRRAATISAGAHVRAMRYCAERLRAQPDMGVPEYEIEAELLHEFRRHGAQSPAYPSIVAAGANACVLHYAASNAVLKAGELCLIDAGCELDGYASDITRTFPANGRFSNAQRELYEIVLAAQDAAMATTRPGARQRDAHHAAVRVLAQGMLDTGLLNRNTQGDLDAVIAGGAYRQFYMHGTGHWLGRDVHDVGEYLSLGEAAFDQPDDLGGRIVKKPSRVLQAGMVVTLEPGLYVRPAEGVPERYWNLGLRIEDDAVVTEQGCELISRGVPVTADEIEALMR